MIGEFEALREYPPLLAAFRDLQRRAAGAAAKLAEQAEPEGESWAGYYLRGAADAWQSIHDSLAELLPKDDS